MRVKYMGSKSWLAPHVDRLLGDVAVLHSPFFGSGKLEYYLATRRPALEVRGVDAFLQAWQGEASRCREADGQLLGAEGDHAGHESGRVRRPCCSTSGARVLFTTGFEELRRYDDVRVPEPSHQARHDLPRRQGLEHRQAPAEH